MKWYMDESVIPNRGGYISAVLMSEKTAKKLVYTIKKHLKIKGYTVKNELKLFDIVHDKKGKKQIEWIKRTINTRIDKKNIKFFEGIKDTKQLIEPYQVFINELLNTKFDVVVDDTGLKFRILNGITNKKRVAFQKSHNSPGIQIADLALALKTK